MKTQDYHFEKIDYYQINKELFNSFPNKSLFTSYEWIDFVSKDSGAEPYILKIINNGAFIGYFSSLIKKIYGIKILGSPFTGWSTPFMGLDLIDHTKKYEVLLELKEYLLRNTKCHYFQIADRDFNYDEIRAIGFAGKRISTLEMDIDVDDAALFKLMKTDCRNFIRQFERRGARFEESEPNIEFAQDYYNQLVDVFAKQKSIPTYGLQKIQNLFECLRETNNVLCLRVISPEGKCIATSIFPGFNNKFYFLGGASYRKYQYYRPNEYMIYKAIQFWRDKGFKKFDMVGVRDYKKKFGSKELTYSSVIFARYGVMIPLKRFTEKLFYLSRKIFGLLMFRK